MEIKVNTNLFKVNLKVTHSVKNGKFQPILRIMKNKLNLVLPPQFLDTQYITIGLDNCFLDRDLYQRPCFIPLN